MNVKLKSNKRKTISRQLIILLLLAMCVIFITNPSLYSKSCLNAISIWAINVLPFLFPFFIFTRLIVNLSSLKVSFADKFFNKLYNTNSPSFMTFFLSVLSGYPMGAKLICSLYESNRIDKNEANKLLSFTSISGPMFIIGTVGIAFLKSFNAGVIILIANIIASLINGMIYRGKQIDRKNFEYISQEKSNVLSDSVYDSLISILMVGAYIVLSFLIIDVLKNIGFINLASTAICGVFNFKINQNIVESVLIGSIEMTRGILILGNINCTLALKTIISSGLIGFGGISILMQSISFLTKLNIPIKNMLIQKYTQAILCIIVTIVLVLIFKI